VSLRTTENLRLDSKLTAFPHQAAAVNALKDLSYCAIFHEQGLGKTKIAIDLCLLWLKDGVVDSVLILTKRSLIENWLAEIRANCHLLPHVLSQNRRDNFFALNSPSRLYLAHYETMISEAKRMQLFQKTRKVGVICDEAQKMKNPDSNLTRCMFALAPGFLRRVIMTGTPVANRPFDIWAPIWFLDQGKSLGNDFERFKAETDLSSELQHSPNSRKRFEDALTDINERISAFSVRETKISARLELPDKQIINVYADFEPEQKQLYSAYRDDLQASIFSEGMHIIDDAEDILKRLLRLVQVASNPALVDNAYAGQSGKLAILYKLVEEAVAKDTKIIIWSSFTENVDYLVGLLGKYNPVAVHGKRSLEERNLAISDFKLSEATKVLIATPGSAKEGLTLTVATYAVFYDRSFSLDDYLQAQDRIHRISQTSKCYIYNIIMRDSVDEWVDALLAAKSLAAKLVQGDISPDEYRAEASYSFFEFLSAVLNPPNANRPN
jgi:SNF2 family DNA or RNA helicase